MQFMNRQQGRWFLFAVIIVLMQPFALSAQSIDDLTFMTEQYPPYNFEEEGEVRGISVDLLLLILQQTKSPQKRDDIKLVPWARGYQTVLKRPNTCLFSMTRTKTREPLFTWVGPIIPTRVSLIAKKDRSIRIESVKDLGRYSIGVVVDDIGEQLLEETGVPLNVEALAGIDVLQRSLKKLKAGRMDLWAYEENVAKYAMESYGFDSNEYEAVYTLAEEELYYACHKDTPGTVINQLQKALNTLKAGDVYQKIVETY